MSDSDFLIKTKYECKYCHKLFATTKHDFKRRYAEVIEEQRNKEYDDWW